MKMLPPARPVFRALFALLSLAAFTAVPAQAQSGWQLDHYECNGSTQYTDGAGAHTLSWPATVSSSSSVSFGYGDYGNPCQSVGTVSAVFVWHGSGQSPAKLSVLITSHAETDGTPTGPDPDDGFQDAPTLSGGHNISQGSQVVQVSNSGQNMTVKTDAYSLSAICGSTGYMAPISFLATVGGGSLSGDSTADTAGWDPTHLYFFSGTACTAKGTAVALSGNVSHAQLCIGENGSDTVVNEYFAPTAPGVPGAASVPLNAMFDSTHFKDGAKIKLTLKVWDTNGGNYEVEVTGPAKNRLYAYANQAGVYHFNSDIVLPNIKESAESMDYFAVTTEEDRKSAVLSTIPAYTAIYVGSHGSPTSIGDCYAELNSGDDYYLDESDIQNAINSKNASQPPYNFVFLDCCNTAGDVTYSPYQKFLASSFLNGNLSSPDGLSDRAFLGWKNEVDTFGLNFQWTETTYSSLAHGYTVSDATLMATCICPETGTNSLGIRSFVFPAIYGDTKMKMHGVYGDAAIDENIRWYRPL